MGKMNNTVLFFGMMAMTNALCGFWHGQGGSEGWAVFSWFTSGYAAMVAWVEYRRINRKPKEEEE